MKEAVSEATGRILQGKMDEFNDFDHAPLKVTAFDDFTIRNGMLNVRMPACSVAEIRISV